MHSSTNSQAREASVDISIVIVNWNSVEFAKNCIASIEATIAPLDYEIIVVDNASEPAACLELSRQFAHTRVICGQSNIGFARASNLGARHSSGKNILFLNPDTIILGKAIQKMVSKLEGHSAIGAVGAKLLNKDRTVQSSCVRPFPTIFNQLFAIDYLKRRAPRLTVWGTKALLPENIDGCHEVEALSGACIMVRSSVFEAVAGFSTDFFMYAEDTDLCYKIRRDGWTVLYVGEAEIVHLGGQSSEKRDDGFSDVVMRESVFTFLLKYRGPWYARLYRGALFVSASLRLAILCCIVAISDNNRSKTRRAFTKWLKIATWSMGRETWVRSLSDNQVQPSS